MPFVLSRMDATLKELTSLVKEVYPEARKKGTHFSFSIVYPDPRGKVYRLVSYDSGTDGKQVCVKHCWFKLVCSSQVERHWQHRVGQEGRGRLPDITVAALPDRRLPRHRYHAAQQSPAPQHTHEALLNMKTDSCQQVCGIRWTWISVFFSVYFSLHHFGLFLPHLIMWCEIKWSLFL